MGMPGPSRGGLVFKTLRIPMACPVPGPCGACAMPGAHTQARMPAESVPGARRDRARTLSARQSTKKSGCALALQPSPRSASALAKLPNTRSPAQLQCDVHVPALTMTRRSPARPQGAPCGPAAGCPGIRARRTVHGTCEHTVLQTVHPLRPPNATLRTGGRLEA